MIIFSVSIVLQWHPFVELKTTTRMTTIHINELPNECIVKIFEKVGSLKELMTLGIVCKRWMEIQELTLKLCTTLKLCSRQFDYSNYGCLLFLDDNLFEDTLTIDVINESTCQFLVAKFPLIVNLSIYECRIEMTSLTDLLSNWSEKLESFTFIGQSVNRWSMSQPQNVMYLQQLIGAFVSLKHLKHLFTDLSICRQLYCIFSQLETIAYINAEPGIFYRILANLTDKIETISFTPKGYS